MRNLLVLLSITLLSLGCSAPVAWQDASATADATLDADVVLDAGAADVTVDSTAALWLDATVVHPTIAHDAGKLGPHKLGMDYPSVGGDLSGSTNAATVVGIQGKAVPTPTTGVLAYDGGGGWYFTSGASGTAGGDLTGTYPNPSVVSITGDGGGVTSLRSNLVPGTDGTYTLGATGAAVLDTYSYQYQIPQGSNIAGLSQLSPTTDITASHNLTIQAESAYSGATVNTVGGNLNLAAGGGATSNGTPGNVVAQLGSPTGSGTHANFAVTEGGSTVALLKNTVTYGDALYLNSSTAFTVGSDGSSNTYLNAPTEVWTTISGALNTNFTTTEFGPYNDLTMQQGDATHRWTTAYVQNISTGSTSASIASSSTWMPMTSTQGTNQTGGNAIVALQSPLGTGTHSALELTEGGSRILTLGAVPGGGYGIWFSSAAPTGSNYSFLGDGTNAYFNAPSGSGALQFLVGNAVVYSVTSSQWAWTSTTVSPSMIQNAVASTSSASGSAGQTFAISAQPGQAATGASHTGGAGGALDIIAGTGGTSGSSTAGAGGNLVLSGGAGGGGGAVNGLVEFGNGSTSTIIGAVGPGGSNGLLWLGAAAGITPSASNWMLNSDGTDVLFNTIGSTGYYDFQQANGARFVRLGPTGNSTYEGLYLFAETGGTPSTTNYVLQSDNNNLLVNGPSGTVGLQSAGTTQFTIGTSSEAWTPSSPIIVTGSPSATGSVTHYMTEAVIASTSATEVATFSVPSNHTLGIYPTCTGRLTTISAYAAFITAGCVGSNVAGTMTVLSSVAGITNPVSGPVITCTGSGTSVLVNIIDSNSTSMTWVCDMAVTVN